MDIQSPFFSNSKFYAQQHFPYGIGRSGEFTKLQTSLLETHGKAYEALHSGQREPLNDEERQFVAVCRGQAAASTDHEKAWLLFCEKTNKKRVSCSLGYSDQSDDYVDDIGDEEW